MSFEAFWGHDARDPARPFNTEVPTSRLSPGPAACTRLVQISSSMLSGLLSEG